MFNSKKNLDTEAAALGGGDGAGSPAARGESAVGDACSSLNALSLGSASPTRSLSGGSNSGPGSGMSSPMFMGGMGAPVPAFGMAAPSLAPSLTGEVHRSLSVASPAPAASLMGESFHIAADPWARADAASNQSAAKKGLSLGGIVGNGAEARDREAAPLWNSALHSPCTYVVHGMAPTAALDAAAKILQTVRGFRVTCTAAKKSADGGGEERKNSNSGAGAEQKRETEECAKGDSGDDGDSGDFTLRVDAFCERGMTSVNVNVYRAGESWEDEGVVIEFWRLGGARDAFWALFRSARDAAEFRSGNGGAAVGAFEPVECSQDVLSNMCLSLEQPGLISASSSSEEQGEQQQKQKQKQEALQKETVKSLADLVDGNSPSELGREVLALFCEMTSGRCGAPVRDAVAEGAKDKLAKVLLEGKDLHELCLAAQVVANLARLQAAAALQLLDAVFESLLRENPHGAGKTSAMLAEARRQAANAIQWMSNTEDGKAAVARHVRDLYKISSPTDEKDDVVRGIGHAVLVRVQASA